LANALQINGVNILETIKRVEMKNIVKSFGGVHALKNVSLEVLPGEIHALIGENGAGKSTLMKILSGALHKDSGEIKLDGKPCEIDSPATGRALGIGIIYQEFALAPHLTVAENIFMGQFCSKNGFIDWSNLNSKAKAVIEDVGFNINPQTRVKDLSVAYQQVVEITKALSENVNVLILDEPTAVLSPQEAERLFEILFKLKEQGVSIIYISHRLEEIFKISDRITVMRDGEVTGQLNRDEAVTDNVIKLMIGRNLSTLFPERHATIGEEVLRVEHLTNEPKVRDISFSVKAGEVLGFAGLVGSGRTEVMRAIFGADRKQSGAVYLDQKLLAIKSPTHAVQSGIGLLPESRKEQGVLLNLPIRINITMAAISKIVRFKSLINRKKEVVDVMELVRHLSIKTNNIENNVSSLSGGNQQKVSFAKWANADCRVIILDEPTRGVDVGAKTEIYDLINKLAESGLAVIVVSSELLEIIGLCDRVAVMNQGQIRGFLDKPDLSEEKIMKLAIGRS
jgi:ribose transport system ATP-binding protein